ncbi:MAG: hypothetical protein ACOH2H_17570 [Cypionkella sp.]
MKRYLVAAALLTLAACGTPQEQCIRLASHDVIVLDRLIAETQGNLSRGYALVETVETRTVFRPCNMGPSPTGRMSGHSMCDDDIERTVITPVAIDLKAEAAKLASMQERRAQIARGLMPAINECKARYPE